MDSSIPTLDLLAAIGFCLSRRDLPSARELFVFFVKDACERAFLGRSEIPDGEYLFFRHFPPHPDDTITPAHAYAISLGLRVVDPRLESDFARIARAMLAVHTGNADEFVQAWERMSEKERRYFALTVRRLASPLARKVNGAMAFQILYRAGVGIPVDADRQSEFVSESVRTFSAYDEASLLSLLEHRVEHVQSAQPPDDLVEDQAKGAVSLKDMLAVYLAHRFWSPKMPGYILARLPDLLDALLKLPESHSKWFAIEDVLASARRNLDHLARMTERSSDKARFYPLFDLLYDAQSAFSWATRRLNSAIAGWSPTRPGRTLHWLFSASPLELFDKAPQLLSHTGPRLVYALLLRGDVSALVRAFGEQIPALTPSQRGILLIAAGLSSPKEVQARYISMAFEGLDKDQSAQMLSASAQALKTLALMRRREPIKDELLRPFVRAYAKRSAAQGVPFAIRIPDEVVRKKDDVLGEFAVYVESGMMWYGNLDVWAWRGDQSVLLRGALEAAQVLPNPFACSSPSPVVSWMRWMSSDWRSELMRRIPPIWALYIAVSTNGRSTSDVKTELLESIAARLPPNESLLFRRACKLAQGNADAPAPCAFDLRMATLDIAETVARCNDKTTLNDRLYPRDRRPPHPDAARLLGAERGVSGLTQDEVGFLNAVSESVESFKRGHLPAKTLPLPVPVRRSALPARAALEDPRLDK